MLPNRAVVGLLALPFVPLVARWVRFPDASDWCWQAALVGLVLAGAVRPRVPRTAGPAAVAAVVGAVVVLWSVFYTLDLHRARFAWALLLVPAGVLLGAAGGRRGAALGGVVALTAIWALLVRRADNGCTGTSAVYGAVVLLHPALALWTAPFLFGRTARPVHES